jgi:hypothetical protein
MHADCRTPLPGSARGEPGGLSLGNFMEPKISSALACIDTAELLSEQ